MRRQLVSTGLSISAVITLIGCSNENPINVESENSKQTYNGVTASGLQIAPSAKSSQLQANPLTSVMGGDLAKTLGFGEYYADFYNYPINQPAQGWSCLEGSAWYIKQNPNYNNYPFYFGTGYSVTQWDVVPVKSNYWIFVGVRPASTTGVVVDVIGRMSTNKNFYMAELGNQKLSIWKRKAGSFSLIAQTPAYYNVNGPYMIYFALEGTKLTAQLYQGSSFEASLVCYDGTFSQGKTGLRSCNNTWVEWAEIN